MTEKFTKEWIAQIRESSQNGQLVLMRDYLACVDEIERQAQRIVELEALLDTVTDKKQTVYELLTNTIGRRDERIAELEQEQRWIPFSEWKFKEDGIYVYKRLNNVIELAHFEHDVKPYYSKYIKNVFNMRIPLPPSWKED